MSYTIYGKQGCKFCTMAKELLDNKEIRYKYLLLDEDYTREELAMICQPIIPRTLPQIFKHNDNALDDYIGGFTELKKSLS